jgi:hypothetical protein
MVIMGEEFGRVEERTDRKALQSPRRRKPAATKRTPFGDLAASCKSGVMSTAKGGEVHDYRFGVSRRLDDVALGSN